MTRDCFDATCNSCGKEIKYITGDPQICPGCGLRVEYQPVIKGEISTPVKEGSPIITVGKSREIHS